jgi:hypothetical protein
MCPPNLGVAGGLSLSVHCLYVWTSLGAGAVILIKWDFDGSGAYPERIRS